MDQGVFAGNGRAGGALLAQGALVAVLVVCVVLLSRIYQKLVEIARMAEAATADAVAARREITSCAAKLRAVEADHARLSSSWQEKSETFSTLEKVNGLLKTRIAELSS